VGGTEHEGERVRRRPRYTSLRAPDAGRPPGIDHPSGSWRQGTRPLRRPSPRRPHHPEMATVCQERSEDGGEKRGRGVGPGRALAAEAKKPRWGAGFHGRPATPNPRLGEGGHSRHAFQRIRPPGRLGPRPSTAFPRQHAAAVHGVASGTARAAAAAGTLTPRTSRHERQGARGSPARTRTAVMERLILRPMPPSAEPCPEHPAPNRTQALRSCRALSVDRSPAAPAARIARRDLKTRGPAGWRGHQPALPSPPNRIGVRAGRALPALTLTPRGASVPGRGPRPKLRTRTGAPRPVGHRAQEKRAGRPAPRQAQLEMWARAAWAVEQQRNERGGPRRTQRPSGGRERRAPDRVPARETLARPRRCPARCRIVASPTNSAGTRREVRGNQPAARKTAAHRAQGSPGSTQRRPGRMPAPPIPPKKQQRSNAAPTSPAQPRAPLPTRPLVCAIEAARR